MVVDLQKAGIWKRLAAWMFDGILTCVLAVGISMLLSWLLGYDANVQAMEDTYAKFESQYGIEFNVSAEVYEAMTEQERQNYDAAYEALIADEEALQYYNRVTNQTLIIITFSLLIAILILEFAIPLRLGNGQTVGKKIFSLGLIRTDSVQVNTMQLFARALLGKFTVETMIPVYILIMIFFSGIGIAGTVALLAIGVIQFVLLVATRNNSQIHDLVAGTIVVDVASQTIFRDTEELVAYTKRIHAERAARQKY